MQTPSTLSVDSADIRTKRRPGHRRLTIHEPLADCNVVEISAWVAEDPRPRDGSFQGRAHLSIGAGPFRLSLSPTVAELRGLALLLTATADDQEMRNSGWMPGQQPDDLEHAVAQLVRGVGQ